MKVTAYIKKSLVHWQRMRRWVAKQNPRRVATRKTMMAALGEDWGSAFCPLCTYAQIVHDKAIAAEHVCNYCPLKGCSGYEWASGWVNVEEAGTWGEWLDASCQVVQKLQEALERESKTGKKD